MAKKSSRKKAKKPAGRSAGKPVKSRRASAKAKAKGKKGPAGPKPGVNTKARSARLDPRSFFAGAPVITREGGNVRVLIGKAGLDGHDRGAKVIARACRDAGFEVVYTGLHQTPEMIVNTAIQEDVDVVGLSILSGAHNHLVPEVIKHLRASGVKVGEEILVLVGGIIPEGDFPFLRQAGVSMIFTPGTSVESIVGFIRDHVHPKG